MNGRSLLPEVFYQQTSLPQSGDDHATPPLVSCLLLLLLSKLDPQDLEGCPVGHIVVLPTVPACSRHPSRPSAVAPRSTPVLSMQNSKDSRFEMGTNCRQSASLTVDSKLMARLGLCITRTALRLQFAPSPKAVLLFISRHPGCK